MKMAFVSLGCDKNLVDSEVMLGLCKQAGIEVVSDESIADVIVVNTCCFIQDALDESIEAIVEMGHFKEEGNCKGLIVAGCLGQRYEKEIFEEMPEVDAVVGTTAYEKIVEVAKRVCEGEKIKEISSIDAPMINEDNSYLRVISTAGHFAYLKIAEGCDNHCTYCVIPKLRGAYRSRKIESLVKEAEVLAQQGIKELILVAQDTALYGTDIYGKSCLDKLLTELCKVDGIEWIRILYCYPEHITDETIEVMAREEKICNYLDMPIQSGCDTVLKRMGRKNTAGIIMDRVNKLRQAMPDITLRTTLISGFPNETEEEFEKTLKFVEEGKFDRLGVFTYSQEEGTPAAMLPNQIDEEIKQERKDIIMDMQKFISAKKCEEAVGKKMKVIIEGKLPEDKVYCGRSYKDAPDIDGLIFVDSEEELLTGDFVEVVITAASDYDLYGKVAE
ncbi:MAG: 30S ribosomal protein S12 methylthiotransferase RimO [Anaerotignaceae bacterium]